MYAGIMAKSAAAKQREYRARRDEDPVRRAAYLQRERTAWSRRKTEKNWRPITELSEREQRKRRRYNRHAQKRYRERQSRLRAMDTPPATPEDIPSLPCSSSRWIFTKYLLAHFSGVALSLGDSKGVHKDTGPWSWIQLTKPTTLKCNIFFTIMG